MLRLLLTPRWLARTALAVVVAGVFVWLGLWQWDRAQAATGRGTNVAYAIEWFVFAGFVFFCLWHWLKDSRDAGAAGAGAADPVAAEPPPPPLPHRRRPAPAPAVDAEDDPELAAYNAYLARLAQGTQGAQGARGGGR